MRNHDLSCLIHSRRLDVLQMPYQSDTNYNANALLCTCCELMIMVEKFRARGESGVVDA
jgi:hypothetical protein